MTKNNLLLAGPFYPLVVSWINCYKEESSIQEITANILDAQTAKHPNVKAALQNGQIEYFDFPSGYGGLRGWSTGILGKEKFSKLSALINQTVTMKVGDTKYALFEPARKIWAIHSDKVDMPFESIQIAVRESEFSKILLAFEFFGLLLFVALVGLCLYGDLRDRKPQPHFMDK